MREDDVLPRLPALLVWMRGGDPPASPGEALQRLRAEGISLIFDAATKTLTADTAAGERIAIG